MDFKEHLERLKRALDDAAAFADGLDNKHLRDLIKDAAGRMHDAMNHPDAEVVVPGVPANTDVGGDPNAQHVNAAAPFPGGTQE